MNIIIYVAGQILTFPQDDVSGLFFGENKTWSTDFEIPLTDGLARAFNIYDIYNRQGTARLNCQIGVGSRIMPGILNVDEINVDENVLKCWLEVEPLSIYEETRLKYGLELLDNYLPKEEEWSAYTKGRTLPLDAGMYDYDGNLQPYCPYYHNGSLYDVLTRAGYSVEGGEEQIALSQSIYPTSSGIWLDKSFKMEKIVFGEDYNTGSLYLSGTRLASGVYGGFTDEVVDVAHQRLSPANDVNVSRIRCEKKLTTAASSRSIKVYTQWSVPTMNEGQGDPSDYEAAAIRYYGSLDTFHLFGNTNVPFEPNRIFIYSNQSFNVVGALAYHQADYDASKKMFYVSFPNTALPTVRNYYTGNTDYNTMRAALQSEFGNNSFEINTEAGSQEIHMIFDIFCTDFVRQPYLGWVALFPNDSEVGNVQMPNGSLQQEYTGSMRFYTTRRRLCGYTTWNDHHYERNEIMPHKPPYSYGYDGDFVFSDCPNFIYDTYKEQQFLNVKSLSATSVEAQLGKFTAQQLLSEYSRAYDQKYSIDSVRGTIKFNDETTMPSLNARPRTSIVQSGGYALETQNLWDNSNNLYPNVADQNTAKKSTAILLLNEIVNTTDTPMIHNPTFRTQDRWRPLNRVSESDGSNPMVSGCVYDQEKGKGLYFIQRFAVDDTVNFLGLSFILKGYNAGANTTYLEWEDYVEYERGSTIKLNTYMVEITEKEYSDGIFSYKGMRV